MRVSRRSLIGMMAALAAAGAFAPAALCRDLAADVVVVGSGAAGLSAALSACEQGASVVVLEKMPTIGGNTLASSGLFNAPDPDRQKLYGIEDSVELFYRQTYEAGHRKADPRLVRILTENALDTMHWLGRYGVTFKKEVLQIYGGLWPRGHYPSISHGRGYVAMLAKACQERSIPIMTGMNVIGFLRDEGGAVTGVTVLRHGQKEQVTAMRGVVLATGGFTANRELCARLDPRLEGMNYTGRPGATGEMLQVAEKIGAKLSDMGEIQCNLGPEKQDQHRSGYHTDVLRHILVNRLGRRFVAEDGLRDALRDAVLAQPGREVFSIVDSDGFQGLSSLFQQAGIYGEREGTSWQADTIAGLARQMQVPPETLEKTVADYNRAIDTKHDPFGREQWMLMKKIIRPPFYASRMRMSIHYTMGGIAIDTQARVLDRRDRPIPGLYAAGEVTAGVHGSNRVGGNGVLDAFVFGRIAGKSAAGPH